MLFLLPYDSNVPYYLGDAPAGADAGSTVDYRFEAEFGPLGDRSLIYLIRQIGLSVRGSAQLEIDFKPDGGTDETLTVYIQTFEPDSPAVGDYWLDTSQSPHQLRQYEPP